MKQKVQLFTILFSIFLVSAIPQGEGLVILHTNDLHSWLLKYDNKNIISPLAKISTSIKKEKNNSKNLLVVDAGDFLMGTPFQLTEVETAFTLKLMGDVGYDVIGLGNHEFDFDFDNLNAMLRKAESYQNCPSIVNSNLLYRSEFIKPYKIIEKGDFKIGVFSVMGRGATKSANILHTTPFESAIKKSKETIAKLKKEGVDLIICISHSGISFPEKNKAEGEDVDLARKVPGIDIIISGHSHTETHRPVFIENTMIVQAGDYGRFIGKLELDSSKKLVSYSLIPLDKTIKEDEIILNKIVQQKFSISKKTFQTRGFGLSDTLCEIGESFFIKNFNFKNLTADVVTDAIYNYQRTKKQDQTDLVIIANGMIRAKLTDRNKRIITPYETFCIYPLGIQLDSIPQNDLISQRFSGKEIIKIFEILLIANSVSNRYKFHFSGCRIKVAKNNPPFKKVQSIEFRKDNAYTELDLNKKYILTCSKVLFNQLYSIEKRSNGILKIKGEGAIESDSICVWDALNFYFQNMPDTNKNGIPDFSPIYRYNNPRITFSEY